ncbi:hypothetical protein CUJ84_Chr000324 [Rhizobium leguminosarum]|uniref:Uncharacterized protein n=1 Tax=Rhizobium leguminosarum TaxID=384 RepID=A0A2K9YXP6_RHILE|nr:hypothetical protein CUJ84_Chr000324 [Rhizobium leguminosarum]
MAINGGFGLWFRELNEVSIGDNTQAPGARGPHNIIVALRSRERVTGWLGPVGATYWNV